ncbi:MAG: DUF5615 family PIN-like protein [Candidatus Eremiobacteraeota bacterium]|nr:DUF5615 family PIN-like protein [Candidatus Eremiobacteraeota bacterium]
MSLLLDENISRHLLDVLKASFPAAEHVTLIGSSESSDAEVWAYAKNKALAILTKDQDFYHRSTTYGFPPKVIWLRCGNCSTKRLQEIVTKRVQTIQIFLTNNQDGLLIIDA